MKTDMRAALTVTADASQVVSEARRGAEAWREFRRETGTTGDSPATDRAARASRALVQEQEALSRAFRDTAAASGSIDTAFDGISKSAEASAAVFAAALDRDEQAMRELASSLDPALRAMEGFEAAQLRIAFAVATGVTEQAEAVRMLDQLTQRYDTFIASQRRNPDAGSARASAGVFEAAFAEQEQAQAARRAFEALEASLDPLVRAERELAQAREVVTRAQQAGVLTDKESARTLVELQSRYHAVVQAQTPAVALAAQRERAIEEETRAVRELMLSVDSAARAQHQFEQAQEQVTRAVRLGIITQEEATQTLRLLEAQQQAVSRGSFAMAGGMAAGIQNASFQITDFIVQVQAGQAVSTALAQQLPQLLGGFSAIGAVLGLVVAAGVPFLSWLFAAKSGADDAETAISELGAAFDAYVGYTRIAAADTADLTEKFGKFAGQVKGFSEYMRQISLGTVIESAGATIDSTIIGLEKVKGAYDQLSAAQEHLAKQSAQDAVSPVVIQLATEAVTQYQNEVDTAAAALGLTSEQALRLLDAMQAVKDARSMEDIAARAGEALAILQSMVPLGYELPAPLRDAAAALEEMQRRAAEANVEVSRLPSLLGLAVDAGNSVAAAIDGIAGAAATAAMNVAAMATNLWSAARAKAAAAVSVEQDTGGLSAQYALYGQGRTAGERLARESGDLYGNEPVLPVNKGRSGGGRSGGSGGLNTVASIKGELARLRPSYEADVEAAEAWRDKALASLKKAGAGYSRYATDVQAIFQEKLADAYEADLKRRDDWAAGIERALLKQKEEMTSWADFSESVMTKWAEAGEDAFVRFVKTGKATLSDFVDFVADAFARMAYQQVIGPGLSSLMGSLLGGIGGIFNLPVGATGAGLAVPTNHTGSPGVMRSYAMSGYGDTARPDEKLTMMRDGEQILTSRALENAGALISTLSALAARSAQPVQIDSRPQVTVITKTSVPLQVEQSETVDDRGGRQQQLVISEAVATGLRAPGGAARRTLDQDFGVRRRGINR